MISPHLISLNLHPSKTKTKVSLILSFYIIREVWSKNWEYVTQLQGLHNPSLDVSCKMKYLILNSQILLIYYIILYLANASHTIKYNHFVSIQNYLPPQKLHHRLSWILIICTSCSARISRRFDLITLDHIMLTTFHQSTICVISTTHVKFFSIKTKRFVTMMKYFFIFCLI